MRRRRLDPARGRIRVGKVLEVSPLCVGMVNHARTVESAHDAGINFFFVSSDLHWPLYEKLRRGLRSLLQRVDRDKVVVCVTSYAGHIDFVKGALPEVLRAIPELGFVDILCAGGLNDDDAERRIEGMVRLRRESACRAIAGSFHSRAASAKAIREGNLDLAFVRFNPLHAAARDDLFPLIRERRIPVFNFKSTTGFIGPRSFDKLELEEGTWQPTVTDYYRFAWGEPALDGILCAPSNPRELETMVSALREGPLAPDDEEHLVALGLRAAEKGVRLYRFDVPRPPEGPPRRTRQTRARKPLS